MTIAIPFLQKSENLYSGSQEDGKAPDSADGNLQSCSFRHAYVPTVHAGTVGWGSKQHYC